MTLLCKRRARRDLAGRAFAGAISSARVDRRSPGWLGKTVGRIPLSVMNAKCGGPALLLPRLSACAAGVMVVNIADDFGAPRRRISSSNPTRTSEAS